MRVLVVEDEQRLAMSLKRGSEAVGFDAIVLDLMLPGVHGYQICATLRDHENWTPILMLTPGRSRCWSICFGMRDRW